MENEEKDDVIVDTEEDTNNEEVEENTEETVEEKESTKPKRTPEEEYNYHKGRADRLAKKLGINKAPEKVVKSSDDNPSSKSDDIDYGQKAFLKTYGIQGSDELALVKSFQSRTGDDLDTLVSDDIFLGKLQSLRDAKASAAAVPKGKGRSGQSGVTDVDLAVAKFREDGTLPTDFTTRNKVVDAITKEEKGDMFTFN